MGKHHACIWVNFSDKNILLDCGEGTAQQLLKNNLDNDIIDAIVISHFHADHISGLFMALQMYYLHKRKKPLLVYLPERIDEFTKSLKLFYLFHERFQFSVDFKFTEDINKDFTQIKIIPTTHLKNYQTYLSKNKLSNPMKSFAFLISENNKIFLYTSDIDNLKDVQNHLANIDLLVMDGFHIDAKDILTLADLKDTRIILNHGLSENLENSLKSLNSNKFEIANEDQEILL